MRHRRAWSAVGWIVVIVAVTLNLMPGSMLRGDSLNDKFMHAVGYSMLTIWFCGIYPRSRHGIIAAGFLLMGIAIEVLQGVMRWGRHADLHDVYADAAGIAVGVLLSWATPLGQWARRAEALFPRRQTD